MKINVSNIPDDKLPDRIRDFLDKEIKEGKLTGWDITRVEMKAPKNKEYPGIIYFKDPLAYPILFSVLEKDSSEPGTYL
jgi:hypothetical protein